MDIRFMGEVLEKFPVGFVHVCEICGVTQVASRIHPGYFEKEEDYQKHLSTGEFDKSTAPGRRSPVKVSPPSRSYRENYTPSMDDAFAAKLYELAKDEVLREMDAASAWGEEVLNLTPLVEVKLESMAEKFYEYFWPRESKDGTGV